MFAIVSGLRTFEIVKVLNNHDALCNDGIIEMYWDRKTKKANAVYCHPLLVQNIIVNVEIILISIYQQRENSGQSQN